MRKSGEKHSGARLWRSSPDRDFHMKLLDHPSQVAAWMLGVWHADQRVRLPTNVGESVDRSSQPHPLVAIWARPVEGRSFIGHPVPIGQPLRQESLELGASIL